MTFINTHRSKSMNTTLSSFSFFLHVLLLTTITLFPNLTSASCTNFTPRSGLLAGSPNDEIYTRPLEGNLGISATVNCSGSALGTAASPNLSCNATQCGISAPNNIHIRFDSILNITVPDTQKADILALIKRNTTQLATNNYYNFNSTLAAIPGSQFAACIPEGTTQYYAFTPTLVCTEGTLGGCSGDGAPANGTGIRACGIKFFDLTSGGFGVVDGTTDLVMFVGESRPGPGNTTFGTNAGNAMSVVRWEWIVGGLGVALLGGS